MWWQVIVEDERTSVVTIAERWRHSSTVEYKYYKFRLPNSLVCLVFSFVVVVVVVVICLFVFFLRFGLFPLSHLYTWDINSDIPVFRPFFWSAYILSKKGTAGQTKLSKMRHNPELPTNIRQSKMVVNPISFHFLNEQICRKVFCGTTIPESRTRTPSYLWRSLLIFIAGSSRSGHCVIWGQITFCIHWLTFSSFTSGHDLPVKTQEKRCKS